MRAQTIEHMFSDITFRKTAPEILDKVKTKMEALQAKIEQRQKRLVDLRREHDIDDGSLIQLLQAARKAQNQGAATFTYSKMSNASVGDGSQMEERTIGAGVVNNLLTESDFIEAEREQIAMLDLIRRNLRPVLEFASDGVGLPDRGFQLSRDELKYLGF
jgi:hypothetical protein